MKRGILPVRRVVGDARPRQHQIDAAFAGAVSGAARELDDRRPALPLGEAAERLFRHTGHAIDRQPLVIGGIEYDRIAIARLGIFHALAVHVLPDRLVAVGIAAALDVVVASEDAALEGAEFLQLLRAGIDFLARQVTGAAGAAELQHRGDRGALRALRPVWRAFRKIADA